MTDKLPPNLLALFAPRPPLRYIPPSDRNPEDAKDSEIGGVAAFLGELKKYKEEVPYNATESWLQRKDRKQIEKKEDHETYLADGAKNFDPKNDSSIKGDALKTLFVSRLSYEVKESDLEREFGRFGPIERIRIVTNIEGEKNPKKKHRGYAFIVYEREKDMKAAYKETDGIRIKDRRILVDVERGRLTKGWKPRRLGGGLGGRGYTKQMPARPMNSGGFGPPSGPGGFGGGFRGGFRGGRGGGGFRGRGDFGGGRGGIGYQGGRGGFQGGQAPPNAPSGPGGNRGYGGGYGGQGGHENGSGPDDRFNRGGGGPRYGDRDGRGGITGSNSEPVRPRDGFRGGYGSGGPDRDPRDSRDGGSHRDYRDRDRDRDSHRERGGDRGDRGGDRDRDRDRGDRYGSSGRREDDGYGRKRYHDGDGYDDPRSKRRY